METLEPQIKKGFTPHQVLILSFLVLISLGTFLLSLPISTKGPGLSFIDALFTATSASCVTGLIVVDTGSRFSSFGRWVILFLIQLGGLGIMTYSTFFILFFTKKLSFKGREIIQQTISSTPYSDIGKLLRSILVFTISIEALGALMLSLRLWSQFPVKKSFYLGIFHSISAFCNAGFSPFSTSLISYRSDPVINLMMAFLIIVGGLGFMALLDIKKFLLWKEKEKRRMLTLHTKIVLVSTAILIGGGMILILLLESGQSLRGFSFPVKLLSSFFQAVTPRTAGFNTVNIGSLANPTILLLMILMFIGASPGSCGGGIKTSTFSVLIALFSARLRGRERVHLFKRTLPQETSARSISILVSSVLVIFLFSLALMAVTKGGGGGERSLFPQVLFEVVSAFGTVGLSMGLTSHLSILGKVLIVMVMFIGRLGPLTVAMAVGESKEGLRYKYPEENVMVG